MQDLPLPIPLLLGALGLVVLLALLIAFFRSSSKPPYQRREEFLSPAELNFFRTLEKAVDPDFYIFSKVRIADLLCVIEGTENYRGWFARISQKHIDFVLANREAVVPVLAIELDDSSHGRLDRQERDEFVDASLEAAGLPLLRVRVQQEYPLKELAAAIRARITPKS
ncbi:MAG TPA: DUF2726 domain-containing protein [Tepidisphaeraceae bacterium]|nr:DUF2726 domain-containing protein [Tepidisphaeraceae bacterium]